MVRGRRGAMVALNNREKEVNGREMDGCLEQVRIRDG